MSADGGDARPGLARVLAAVVYDALVLFAILFAATAAVLPLTDGEAVRPHHPLYSVYLVAVCFAYLGGSWMRGGQTLGMRAWRLQVVRDDGAAPRLRDALARFAAAGVSWLLLGAGFAWIAVDRDRRSLHDRLSRTRLIRIARAPRAAAS